MGNLIYTDISNGVFTPNPITYEALVGGTFDNQLVRGTVSRRLHIVARGVSEKSPRALIDLETGVWLPVPNRGGVYETVEPGTKLQLEQGV